MKSFVEYINERALDQFCEPLYANRPTMSRLSSELEAWSSKYKVEFKNGIDYDNSYKYFKSSAKMNKTSSLSANISGTDVEFITNDASFKMHSGWMEQLKNIVLFISGEAEEPFVIRLMFNSESDAVSFISSVIDD